MHASGVKPLLVAALSLLLHSPAQAGDDKLVPLPSPQVGEAAPALGHVEWRDSPDGKAPSLDRLHGQVVVVYTWVWYRDS